MHVIHFSPRDITTFLIPSLYIRMGDNLCIYIYIAMDNIVYKLYFLPSMGRDGEGQMAIAREARLGVQYPRYMLQSPTCYEIALENSCRNPLESRNSNSALEPCIPKKTSEIIVKKSSGWHLRTIPPVTV